MPTELLYTEPHSAGVLTRTVEDSAEVERIAGELLGRYQDAKDILPGIELRRDGGAALSIAVAPFGWALVHTDEQLDQRCTRRAGAVEDGARHDVRWEEPDAVPDNWFIPTPDAVAVVHQWVSDGTLTSEVVWSDECWQ